MNVSNHHIPLLSKLQFTTRLHHDAFYFKALCDLTEGVGFWLLKVDTPTLSRSQGSLEHSVPECTEQEEKVFFGVFSTWLFVSRDFSH